MPGVGAGAAAQRTSVYGPSRARQLRTLEGGQLKSQQIGSEEFPQYLCENGEIKPEFSLITVVDFGNVRVRDGLKLLYRHVDNIEFYVGLFAEPVPENGVLPNLMGKMVALDAFSQVYTNPLLALRIYNQETFSPLGMEIINSTTTLSQVVNRNVPHHPGGYYVSMTRKDWKRT